MGKKEYDKLLPILKRYSFEEKMLEAMRLSRMTMGANGIVESVVLRQLALPWEIETFVLFSALAKEWKDRRFQKDDLAQIINSIRDQTVIAFNKKKLGMGFTKWFMIVTSATQFDLQESSIYKYYRHNFYFNYNDDSIDMRAEFRNKYGVDYQDFVLFGMLLWSICTVKKELAFDISYQLLASDMYEVAEQLMLPRAEYIKEIEKYASDIDDYLYCLRPSYSYPFIEYKDRVYLPTPHLLIQATTTSLMLRLTDQNDKLREDVGKSVYEAYLFKIITDSGLFDEVIPEFEYSVQKTKAKTLDVMARKNDRFVFFDSKSFVPKVSLRLFSQSGLDSEIERIAKSCVQAYRHIHDKFTHEYNPFTLNADYDQDKIFGLVVLANNPHIELKSIYRKTAEKLGMAVDSDEYEWLCGHVGIVAIHEIERFCFSKSDFFTNFDERLSVKRFDDYWLTGECSIEILDTGVREFQTELTDRMEQKIKELFSAARE